MLILKRFDLVIFPKNKTFNLKRIIGLPGDTLIFMSEGIIINGKKIVIPQKIQITFDKKNKLQKNNIEFKVPGNNFFVIGDNLPASIDSRIYGHIFNNIIYGVSIQQVSGE